MVVQGFFLTGFLLLLQQFLLFTVQDVDAYYFASNIPFCVKLMPGYYLT